MIGFHRAMFAVILTMVFFKGAVDAGRKDLLAELMVTKYLSMSIAELVNVEVRG